MLAEKDYCCGCRACEEVCHMKAITMKPDELGFIYPVIDEAKCVNCGRCERICPVMNRASVVDETSEATVAIHKDKKVLEESASGGAFTAICNAWKKKYPDTYIVGAVWKGDFSVHHEVVNCSGGVERFRKSKYVMSDTNGVFEKVKNLLDSKEAVLFSGTPCQIAALKNYVGRSYDKLMTVDIVCHGAPSAKIFQSHISELSKRYGTEVVSYMFRNKEPFHGKINSRSAKITFANGKSKLLLENEDSYMRAYYARVGYRPSCSRCQYANPKRVSDITICDAHQIESLYPQIYGMQGVSAILYHSKKGLSIKERLEEQMKLYPITQEWVIEHNELLQFPTKIHAKNDIFIRAFLDEKSFTQCVYETIPLSFKTKIKSKIVRVFGQRSYWRARFHSHK